jgi:hypothetical protein
LSSDWLSSKWLTVPTLLPRYQHQRPLGSLDLSLLCLLYLLCLGLLCLSLGLGLLCLQLHSVRQLVPTIAHRLLTPQGDKRRSPATAVANHQHPLLKLPKLVFARRSPEVLLSPQDLYCPPAQHQFPVVLHQSSCGACLHDAERHLPHSWRCTVPLIKYHAFGKKSGE